MFGMLQDHKFKGSWDRVVAEEKTLHVNAIRCPECGQSWSNLVELRRSGGVIRGLGLRLQATCPGCGCAWSVNKNWRCSKVLEKAGTYV